MFKFCGVFLLMLLNGLALSCTTLWSSDADKALKTSDAATADKDVSKTTSDVAVKSSVEVASAPPAIEQTKVQPDTQVSKIAEQISLAQARTVERMSEIEAELRQQREKIKLLEQGLLTGIAPDDLKRSYQKKSDVKVLQTSDVESAADEDIDVALGVVKPSPLGKPVLDADMSAMDSHQDETPEVKLSDAGQFEALLGKARARYQASDFSGALADFADLSRKYGENTQNGILRFWLGKCYAGLKEHTTARQELEAYLARAPKSSQVAEARLELSKVLLRLGLKERAQTELKKVISEFDGQEPAEVAAHELGNLQGSL